MINDTILVVIAASAIAYGTPLLFRPLGELLAERSGVLNLGVEGMMLMGAVTGFWTVQSLHAGAGVSLAAAMAVAALVGAATSLIHAFLVITLRASQIVSGLALTIFAGAAGLSSYLGNDFDLAANPAKHTFHAIFPASWQDLPIVGPIVFGALQHLAPELQARGIHLGPTVLWTNALPYVMTIVVLVVVSASSTRRWLGAPAALGTPYVREER